MHMCLSICECATVRVCVCVCGFVCASVSDCADLPMNDVNSLGPGNKSPMWLFQANSMRFVHRP